MHLYISNDSKENCVFQFKIGSAGSLRFKKVVFSLNWRFSEGQRGFS